MNELFVELLRYGSVHACHAVTLCLMTDCRYGRRVCRLVWAAEGVVNFLIAILGCLFAPGGVNGILFVVISFLSMLSYCAVYACLSKPPWQRALFLFATYANVFLFIMGVSFSLFRQFFADSPLAFILLRNGIFLAFILLLLVVLRPAFLRSTAAVTGGWGTLAALSMVTCVVTFLLIGAIMVLDYPPAHWLSVLTIMLALVGAEYAAILRMIGLLSRQQALRSAESQRKLLESQLAAEQQFVALARSHRHDAHHHATLLADLLEREDTAGMREYLSQYISDLDAATLESYCKHPVADALLRLTARRCREGGVEYTIDAAIPEQLPLTGPELTTVLGNILENAWEAARSCPSPRISITAGKEGALLLFEVENTVDHPVRFEDDLPVTTKAGGGQGLKSVRQTLERHGGMLRCTPKGEVFLTQVVIPL